MGTIPACILITTLIASFIAVFFAMRIFLQAKFWAHLKERGSDKHLDLDSFKLLLQIPILSKVIKKIQARKYSHALQVAMPQGMRLLCIALDAGSSLVKALDYTAQNREEPLASELKRVVWDLRAGQGFDEAMVHLSKRTGGTEFAYLAIAMEIQHKSGGSLGDVLQSVSKMLQQNIELTQDLQSKTAQARLSARVVSIMPIGLLVILSLITQNYIGIFFSSLLGVVMFFAACVLEILGIVLVRKSLNINLCEGLHVA